ncbi:pilus assembly PilX family protein [Methylomonas sp. HW2-6]|uniref:pilus assembly PilX family protein n=1 Tax=Methylomonas sp. HW2-6 TaxID=3376687 RepID=UPI0040435EB6
MKLSRYNNFPSKQRGVVLFTALIFLVALMLIGNNAVQNSGLEERMAGNTRNRDMAFQAAEAALKNAGNTLTTWRVGPWSGAVPAGLVNNPSHANDSSYWGNIANWASYKSYTVTGVAENPRYIIEKLPNVGTVEHYRVTTRAVGGDTSAVVILQAAFSYTPSP